MKAKYLILLAIISLIASKNLRFAADSSENVMTDAMTMLNLINQASSTGLTKMCGHVGMIIDGIATLATTFKNSYSDVLVDKKAGVGFSNLVGKVEFDFNVGYREAGYDFWVNELKKQFFIPEKYKEDFEYTLKIGKFAEQDTLFDDSLLYNKTVVDPNDPTKNIVSFVNLLIYHYKSQNKKKFNAIITSAEANIKLYPNELIYRESKSTAGGIQESSILHSKWENRDLTPKDVDLVVQMLQANSYQTLAQAFGIFYKKK